MREKTYKYLGVYYRPKDPRFPAEIKQDCYVLSYVHNWIDVKRGDANRYHSQYELFEFDTEFQANRALKKLVKTYKIEVVV